MKYLKLLAGLISAVLVAALANGLWDLALKPFLFWLIDSLINIYDNINTGYLDGIIQDSFSQHITPASSAIHTKLQFVTVILFVLLCAHGIKGLTQKINFYEEPSLKDTNVIKLIFLYVTSIAFTVSVFYKISVNDKIASISNYAYSSIEIVRPNMTEREYLELKSQYLQVIDKDDFEKISKTLESYSDESHVLPLKPEL